MIVAIADDITGAAELGGIALRYNLSVIISDDINNVHEYDVLVVYTNTRSMRKEEAMEVMGNLTSKAYRSKPSFFYKKTDSVLRGHVLAEMKAHINAMGVNRGLLVPINPASGRVIKNGHYYINSLPVNETSFASDPEFPINSSRVEEILSQGDEQVNLLKKSDQLSPNGISVGEGETEEDLQAWAKYHDGSVLLAGGGSFFNALLSSMYQDREKKKKTDSKLSSPLCLVSGTTYAKNVERIKKYSPLVSYMPLELFLETDVKKFNYGRWLNEALEILRKNNKVIIAIGNTDRKADPNLLVTKLSEMVKLTFDSTNISELIIEGGSTAYAIVRKLGWHSFVPGHELAQGIVRMQVVGTKDVHLTIKPGSYEWPGQWDFN